MKNKQAEQKKRDLAFPFVNRIYILFFLLLSAVANAQTFDSIQAAPFALPAFGQASTGALVDLDNDGDLDLLSGNYYGNFLYYKNTGTAASPLYWQLLVNPFSLGNTSHSIVPAFADLDNDGDQDLMAGDATGKFLYFENTGTATTPVFAAVQVNPFSLPDIGYNAAPAFADLDNDGDQDLISGTNPGYFCYFVNTGTANNPVFGPIQYNPFSLTTLNVNVIPSFTDLDNDGDQDLMAGDATGNFMYFENTGTVSAPSFSPVQINTFSLAGIGGGSSVSFGDLDNDGDNDLMSGSWNGTYNYFPNNGTLSGPVFGAVQNNPFLIIVQYQSNVALADLDNDGDMDLLSGEYYGTFRYYENEGTAAAPVFSSYQTNPFSLTGVVYNSSPAFGDLDNDGDMDLLVGQSNGNFEYFENTGTISAPLYATHQPNPFSLTDAGDASTPSFADLDNDGDLDLMAGEMSGNFKYYENTGTPLMPVFAAAQTNPFSLQNIGFKTSVTFADLDVDGDLDMLSGEWGGLFIYFANTGTASAPHFGAPQTSPFSLGSVACWSTPAFFDLDDDGDIDMLSGSNSGNFYYFENICIHPSAPGPISATIAGCPGEYSNYSIPELSGVVFYAWTLPDGWSGSSTTDNISVIAGPIGGTVSVAVSNGCALSPVSTLAVNPVTDSVSPSTPVLADFYGACGASPPSPVTTDNCAGIVTGTTTTTFPLTTPGLTVVTWTFADGNGNSVTADQEVIVTAPAMDLSTIQNDLTITANDTTPGTSYQWIDCASALPIAAATGQSYTATANGTYAVIVSQGFCSDTSACVAINTVGISTAGADNLQIVVFPNPSAGLFTLLNVRDVRKLMVTDVTGKLILEQEENLSTIDLSGFENGIYLLVIVQENQARHVMKVVKK